MIAWLHPSDKYIDENISTLTYATKASFISNEPSKNEDPRIRIIHDLRRKIISLESELKAANNHIAFLTNLTGGGKISNKNLLIPETKDKIDEYEIKLLDNIASSIYKSDGTAWDDDHSLKDSNKDNILASQKSALMDSMARFNTITEDENSKSETVEEQSYNEEKQFNQIKHQNIKFNHQENGSRLKYLISIVNNYIVKLDPDVISQRLIESISMVTALLQSNRQLRDSINILSKEKEYIEWDNFVLQTDNIELRDRIEILEGIIKSNSNDFENYDWNRILENNSSKDDASTLNSSSSKGIKSIINSMVGIKKENRSLKKRIEYLESQISDVTSQFDWQRSMEPLESRINMRRESSTNNLKEIALNRSPGSCYDSEKLNINNYYKNIPILQNTKSAELSRNLSRISNKRWAKESKKVLSVRNGLERKSKHFVKIV